MSPPARRSAFRLALLFTSLSVFSLPALSSQENALPSDLLRAKALVVRFLAAAFDDHATGAGASARTEGYGPSLSPTRDAAGLSSPSRLPVWSSRSFRYTMTGSPVALRLAGDDLVVIVQVTPYVHGPEGLTIVAQGQVWRRLRDGSVDYRSAFESLSVAFGERVFFYPLGMRSDGSTAIRLEIAVDHYGDPPSIPEKEGETSLPNGPDQGSPSDGGRQGKR